MPLVHISVLNWRDPEETAACMRALLEMDYPNTQIILVNNGAATALADALDSVPDSVTIVQNQTNLGYSGGNNIAIHRALNEGADYIWLFNSDALPNPDTLSRLVAAMEQDTHVGIASPIVYNHIETDGVWSAGGWFDLKTCDLGRFTDPAEALDFMARKPSGFMLAGAAFFIRASVARLIGGLDEGFFAYHEDTDYCIRAELAGASRVLVTDAAVYHKHGHADFPSLHGCYYMARNETLLWRRYATPAASLRARVWGLARAISSYDRYEGRPDLRRAVFSGWWHGQWGMTGEWDHNRHAPAWVSAIALSSPMRWLLGVEAAPRGGRGSAPG